MIRTADIIARLLDAWGIEKAFGVPGESFLSLLDALYSNKKFEFVNCRHEGGATMAAEAYARATGKLGISMVTRGPGLTNALAGIHVAKQGSTPLIIFVGMPSRETEQREAFQEIDVHSLGQICGKAGIVIRDPSRAGEQLSRAVHLAISNRPGPVIVGLPEDMLSERGENIPANLLFSPTRPYSIPVAEQVQKAAQVIARAKKPFIIAGGAAWRSEASQALEQFAVKFSIPVGAAWRRQDIIDNEHFCFAGHFSLGTSQNLAKRIRLADVIIVISARLGEATTNGYTLFDPPIIKPYLIHIHPDSNELGAVFRPNLALEGDPAATLNALVEENPGDIKLRESWLKKSRSEYVAFSSPIKDVGDLQLAEIIKHISNSLSPETTITNGAGNYAIWLHRFFSYRRFGQQLAPQSGTMGYGVPAAIGAAFANPKDFVIAFAGDGCALMTIQELATISEHQLKIIIIVVDNERYGTIRMHQERDFPDRTIGTDIKSPDFPAIAKGFNISAKSIFSTKDFFATFDNAVKSKKPYLIHLRPDCRVISPGVALK